MLQTNFHYLDKAKSRPEKFLDRAYMFYNKNPELNEHIKKIQKLKELLVTCKVMLDRKEEPTRYYDEIFEIITDNGYGSKSEFVCFMNACRVSQGTLKKNKEICRDIVKLYLEHRDISDSTPKEWVQALIDKGAQRGSGSLGEKKIIGFAKNREYEQIQSWEEFHRENKCIARCKKDVFDNKTIKAELGVQLEFENSNKMLDLIIKSEDKIMFLEAKNLNDAGGAQDKQVAELIKIVDKNLKVKIGNKNLANKVFYLGAYLDGYYSNKLLSAELDKSMETKIERQGKDLRKALKKILIIIGLILMPCKNF